MTDSPMTKTGWELVWSVLRRRRIVSTMVDTSRPSFPPYPLSTRNDRYDHSERSIVDKYISPNDHSDEEREVPEGEKQHTRGDEELRQDLLARDLAKALHDDVNLACYRAFVQRYPEALLRSAAGYVAALPPEKITRSRGAYFVWLVHRYGGGAGAGNPQQTPRDAHDSRTAA